MTPAILFDLAVGTIALAGLLLTAWILRRPQRVDGPPSPKALDAPSPIPCSEVAPPLRRFRPSNASRHPRRSPSSIFRSRNSNETLSPRGPSTIAVSSNCCTALLGRVSDF